MKPPQHPRLLGFFTLVFSLLAVAGCATIADHSEELPTISPASSTPGDDRIPLLLVSLDGFRWDFLNRGVTPHLQAIADRGVRAEKLIPSFPTKTFPNHYTIVTGLYPGHHGIIANNMWDDGLGSFSLSNREAVRDGRWYGGEPIWVTAERQGLLTAPFFWPGSEAAIGGTRPTFWKAFDDNFPNQERIDQIFAWLNLPTDQRPTLLTLYFSDIDHAAHRYGPDNQVELNAALAGIDETIGSLVSGLEERNLTERLNLLIVSDHGMATNPADQQIFLDDYTELDAVRVIDWTPILTVEPIDGDVESLYGRLAGAHPHLKVYRREELPERFHYKDNPRVPSLVAVADDGWRITTRGWLKRHPDATGGGEHGYDNQLDSMGAIFIAAGPGLRSGVSVPPIANIHLYELMCHLLDLEPAPSDGDIETLRGLLR